jgi:GLPGLI family protein
MKAKMFLMAALTAALTTVQAQTSTVKVEYEYAHPQRFNVDKTVTAKMWLLSGPEKSKYYNTMSEYCDSLTSTPEGKQALQKIQIAAFLSQSADGGLTIDKNGGGAPSKIVDLYVCKNFGQRTLTVYDDYGQNDFGYYEEAMEGQDWQINADSTLTVLGYECIQAECDYHGRHWKAWFAADVPVQDGPWKFYGLPGLILRAESGAHVFQATGIEAAQEPIGGVYQTDAYSKVDRRKALKEHESYVNNFESVMKAKMKGIVSIQDENGKPFKVTFNRELQALETDY